MREFAIEFSDTAEMDIDRVFLFQLCYSPAQAGQFIQDLRESIETLLKMPRRCSLAYEKDYF